MLSLKEACAALGVPYTSALYYYRAGRIPVTRIAGRALIAPEALRQALEEVGYRQRPPAATRRLSASVLSA